MDGPIGVHAFVSGRVQGVWYRQSAAEAARARRVGGWARNLPDGRVELWAEGARPDVDAFLAWCCVGPRRAQVTGIEVDDVAPAGLTGFQVRE
ncbi:MAG TPA: acylphosphatase [Acidimicrobiales bacterium]|nr:acylphosphatase [Acidimicrobiales bacterium]